MHEVISGTSGSNRRESPADPWVHDLGAHGHSAGWLMVCWSNRARTMGR